MESAVKEYQEELKVVKKELKEVEQQLQDLLARQSHLADRRVQLEALLKNHETKKLQEADTQWERTDFPWSKKLQDHLRSTFKMETLRPMQLQTMNATLSDRDCLLIMPTGGGKSLCFQLPALVSKGITVVVSPLVSLMEDQVMALDQFGVEAVMLNADVDKTTLKEVQDAMTDHEATLKLIYVTPEKLAKSKRFMNRLEKMYNGGRFARLVIDEVHCCSQWGHDFRPDYKFLGIMKRQFPTVPILGLTATATTKVLEDVKKILSIPSCLILRSSFNRPNLYYQVRQKPSSQEEVMNDMSLLIKSRFSGKSGIVYCFSQKDSQDITVELQKRGIRAGCYHANISAKERSRVHRMWTTDQIDVVVATVAFGMGIDKPDVRFVIHHSLSKSMENLYQESGRAGRDGQRSDCILYYRFADVTRQSTMVFMENTGLENLYGIVAYCIDLSGCRRSRIARHFGEVWDSTQCDGMCDHCDPARKCTTVVKRDVTKLAQDVVRILDNASATNQRVTAPKVLDAWFGKGTPSLRIKEVKAPNITRETAERILACMLLEGYIREDFHFTAYSTICYLVLGNRALALQSGVGQITVELESKAKTPTTPTATATTGANRTKSGKSGACTSPPSTVSQGDKGPKVKPVVINKERSHFSILHKGSCAAGDGKTVPSKSDTAAQARKRKSGVIYDSDENDGDSNKKVTSKSKKEHDRNGKKMSEETKKRQTEEDMADLEDLNFDDSDFDEPQQKVNRVESSSDAVKNTPKHRLSLVKKPKSGPAKGDQSRGQKRTNNVLRANTKVDPICLSDSDDG